MQEITEDTEVLIFTKPQESMAVKELTIIKNQLERASESIARLIRNKLTK